MIIVSSFKLSYNSQTGFYTITSDELLSCPLCSGTLAYRNSRLRKPMNIIGNTQHFLLRRLLCGNKKCGKLHTEIPDIIQPYKHYDSHTIQCVLDDNEEASTCAADDSTIRRWKNSFTEAEPDISQRLTSVYAQMTDEKVPIAATEGILSTIKSQVIRWLSFVMSLLINNGHILRTRFDEDSKRSTQLATLVGRLLMPFGLVNMLIQSYQQVNRQEEGVKEMTKPLKTAVEVATERFNLIAPLVGDGLDKGRRYDLTSEIMERSGVSERTLRRYVSAWKEGGFDALKPKQGWERLDSGLGEGFERIVDAAVELRRESPSRSVADIIKILELEEAIQPRTVARSTLQRHLAARGYASSQMRMYTSKGAAARRFQKEHRNQLWMSDIKHGPFIPGENGRKKQIYLVVWIDDATRYIVSARFYLDQTVGAIEDSLHRAVQSRGVPDKIFVDNGRQFKSKWLLQACAKLGIRLLTSRPYHPEGKGLVERFNRTVEKFISETIFANPSGLAEYNELLRVWLDEYYHKNPHSALSSISPGTAFGTDSRPLKFAPAEQIRDAFLHTEARKVDKTGCVNFQGHLYEVGLAYIGRKIEVRYDPSWTEEIEVVHDQAKPFIAKKLVIGENCGTTQELPEHMRTTPPQTSRMLDGLKKEHQAKHKPTQAANTFKELWKGDAENV